MIPITEMLLTNHNRSMKKLLKLKGIVMHWTANEAVGANAIANRNYFNSTQRSCSAHYIVDDKKIINCVPDNEIAYHVGAQSYTHLGHELLEGPYSPNFFLIGIEMCVNSDGDWKLTYKNSAELAAELLNKHNLSIDNLYRHFDITGKDCPKMMLSTSIWSAFKSNVKDELDKKICKTTFKRNLMLTSSGNEVKTLQKKLNDLGYSPGAVDGIFGYRTMAAIQHFQVKNNLPASGDVNYATFNKLFLGGI